jgi:transcriptional regulator with XRE-family HTH domain
VPATQGNMPEVGPVGRNLIANVEQLRAEQGLSLNRLSVLLGEAGRAVPPLGLSRLAKGERRVDVDELVALAEVLGVTPGELLAPPGAGKPGIDHAAVRAAQDLAERIGQLLAADGDPGAAEALSGYVDRASRRLAIEVEELLAETREQARTSRNDRPSRKENR